MRIQMRSQNGQIAIETQSAQVELDQDLPELDLEIVEPEVRIESTLPKVEISQQQAFSESGLKGILELTAETAQMSRQLLLQGIERVVDQGDQLADASKPDPIPDIARYNSWEQFQHDYNMVTMPVSGPDIQVIEGQTDIQYTKGYVENNTQTPEIVSNYTPGAVNISMKQYPSLEIWTTESSIDIEI